MSSEERHDSLCGITQPTVEDFKKINYRARAIQAIKQPEKSTIDNPHRFFKKISAVRPTIWLVSEFKKLKMAFMLWKYDYLCKKDGNFEDAVYRYTVPFIPR